MEAMSPRSQADRSETTRVALIGAAAKLFATKGFRATSTEEIVAEAGVTRGALYHHYRDKSDLFLAVHQALQQEKSARISAAMAEPDVIAAVAAGIGAYLEACRDPVFQRICHIEAPSVLGYERWRQLATENSLGLIEAGMRRALDAGLIEGRSANVLAHVVHGAIMEAGILVSDNPEVDIKEVEQTLMQLMMGFVTAPSDT